LRHSVASKDRSCSDADTGLRVDDIDTYLFYSAARELEALLLHTQQRQVADVRALLVDLYARDGVVVEETVLDAQAEEMAAQERADRFLVQLACFVHPDAELLELAGQVDDHALGVWREAAASLVDECPPSFLSLRSQVEEEQRGEQRDHAHLTRTEARLGSGLARFSPVGRLLYRRRIIELRSKVAACRQRRARSQQRLAWLEVKLQVIDRAEQARFAWMDDAADVLARGVAAARVLAQRAEQAITVELEAVPARPASPSGPVGPRVAS
jgi:hypothetical protein